MKVFISFLATLFVCDICNGQYEYQQTYNYNYNQQRIHPNQYYPQRVNPSSSDRARQKPSYGRVNPQDYRRIMDRQSSTGTKSVVYPVYPQKQVQVVYPRQQVVYPRQQYKQQVVRQHSYRPVYQKVMNPYVVHKPIQVVEQPKYKPKWPKLRGRCQTVPNIKIDGKNPVREQCSKGRAVLVFLMKRRCDFCYHQLKALNKLAKHYKEAGKPLSVIAINHKRGKLAPAVIKQFPHIKIYEEPENKDIFGKLGGAWRQVILYDVCCRKQYLYGYPFSWMGYSFVRHAIFNTMYYDQVICGVCKAPTPKPKTTKGPTTLPTETFLS